MKNLVGWVKGLGIVISGAIAFSGNSAIANINQDTNLANNSGVVTQENTRMVEGVNYSGSNQERSCKQRSVSTLALANFQNAANLQNKNTGVTNPVDSRLGNEKLKLRYSLDPTHNQVNTAVKKREIINLAARNMITNTLNERCLVCGFTDEGVYVCVYYDC